MQTTTLRLNYCSEMDFDFVLVNQIKQTFRRGFLTTLPSLGPHLSSSQLMCAIVPLHYQWIWSYDTNENNLTQCNFNHQQMVLKRRQNSIDITSKSHKQL